MAKTLSVWKLGRVSRLHDKKYLFESVDWRKVEGEEVEWGKEKKFWGEPWLEHFIVLLESTSLCGEMAGIVVTTLATSDHIYEDLWDEEFYM